MSLGSKKATVSYLQGKETKKDILASPELLLSGDDVAAFASDGASTALRTAKRGDAY